MAVVILIDHLYTLVFCNILLINTLISLNFIRVGVTGAEIADTFGRDECYETPVKKF